MLIDELVAKLKSNNQIDVSLGVTFAGSFHAEFKVLLPLLSAITAHYLHDCCDPATEIIVARSLTSAAHLIACCPIHDRAGYLDDFHERLTLLAKHSSKEVSHHADYALKILSNAKQI